MFAGRGVSVKNSEVRAHGSTTGCPQLPTLPIALRALRFLECPSGDGGQPAQDDVDPE
jgi:hypothetical protein